MNKKLPRGIRNNNPGNIRIGSSSWQGKVPIAQNTDGSFEQFQDHPKGTAMQMGVRALTKLGHTYLRQNPLHTISSFIGKYAPTNENNTQAYINFVAKKVGVSADTKVVDIYKDIAQQYLFILAIIEHENGQGINNIDISKGIELGNA